MDEPASRPAFLSGLAAILVAAVLAAAAGSLLLPADAAELVVPVAVGGVLAIGYFVRPRAALLAFGLLTLFVDTLDLYLGQAIKPSDEVAVLAFAAITVVRSWVQIRRQFHLVRESAITLAVLAGVVSSLINGVPLTIWVPALLLFGKAIAIFYIASVIGIRVEHLRRYSEVVVGLALILVALGLIESFNPAAFQNALGLPEYVRIRGGIYAVKSLFFHPVLFGWFTAFVALYLYAFFLIHRRWWMLAAALFLSMGTILSARRRPLLGIAVALATGLAWFVRQGYGLRQIVLAWLPVAAGTAALAVVFLPVLLGLYGLTVERYLPPGDDGPDGVGRPPIEGESDPGDEGTAVDSARIALYRGSVDIGVDRFPLGVGFGRYGSRMSEVEYSPVYAEYGLDDVNGLRPRNPRYATDTFWPMVLGELGVIGLIGYAVFFGAVGWGVWRRSRAILDPWGRAFALGTVMVFVEVFVESLARPSLIAPPSAYFAFGAAGLLLSLPRDLDAEPPASSADPAEP